jgi:hypothetical protein
MHSCHYRLRRGSRQNVRGPVAISPHGRQVLVHFLTPPRPIFIGTAAGSIVSRSVTSRSIESSPLLQRGSRDPVITQFRIFELPEISALHKPGCCPAKWCVGNSRQMVPCPFFHHTYSLKVCYQKQMAKLRAILEFDYRRFTTMQ